MIFAREHDSGVLWPVRSVTETNSCHEHGWRTARPSLHDAWESRRIVAKYMIFSREHDTGATLHTVMHASHAKNKRLCGKGCVHDNNSLQYSRRAYTHSEGNHACFWLRDDYFFRVIVQVPRNLAHTQRAGELIPDMNMD